MLAAAIVNSVGLVANIAGVALVFFYGYPQPSFEESTGIAVEPGTVFEDGTSEAGNRAAVRALRGAHLFWSRWGLRLMGLGFVLQVVATWIAWAYS